MFAPTPNEVALVNQVFQKGDPQKLGIVTGEQGVKIFAGSSLLPATLGDIWALSDPENNGYLTRKGVAISLRLIGWAQAGEEPSSALLEKAGPLARIDGIPQIPTTRTPAPIVPISAAFPPLSPQDRSKFLQLFNNSGPVAGLLSGEKARALFVKSKLPIERLNAIWGLADIQNRGSLTATEFVLAMYFIQGSMTANPAIRTLPPSIPPFLLDQASGRPPATIGAQNTGGSIPSPGFPSSSLVSQYTGSMPALQAQSTGSILQAQRTGRNGAGSPVSTLSRIPPAIPARASSLSLNNQLTGLSSPFPLARAPTSVFGAHWDITPEEKMKSDGFFDGLDTSRSGYIEGGAAVPFMLQSGLSEETLARVWDLSDLLNDGRLTKDSFAVAMHLINSVLAGNPLPETLPPTLIPPSFRAGAASGLSPQQPQANVISETQQDLWLLDEAVAIAPLPHPAVSPAATTLAAAPSASPSVPAPAHVGASLIDGDDEAEERAAKKISENSVEIANLKNQLSSTQTAFTSAQTERERLEAELSTSAATLSQLQTQLASSKVGFDTETKLLTVLRERYATQTADIHRTRDELIHAESDLSGLRLEKAEIAGSLLREKEDLLELERKIKATHEETRTIKAELEKGVKDLRHQKGLLAIAKKQLSTAEAQRDAAKLELSQVAHDLETTTSEAKETEASWASITLGSGDKPLSAETSSPTIPQEKDDRTVSLPSEASPAFPFAEESRVTSPAPVQSNNPFGRLMQPSSPGSVTPQLTGVIHTGPTEPAHIDEDPFGFNEGNEEPKAQSTADMLNGFETTPKQVSREINGSIDSHDDSIFAPPSSATDGQKSDLASPTGATLASGPAGRFPALVDDRSSDTELPPLKEIEEKDEDSDESDDEPLGKKFVSNPQTTSKPLVPASASDTAPTSFGDAFTAGSSVGDPTDISSYVGVSTAGTPSQTSPTTSVDPAPLLHSRTEFDEAFNPSFVPSQGTGTSGTDAFDAAMGLKPSGQPAVDAAFQFNSFSDTFNFDSAFAPTQQPAVNPPNTNAVESSISFDDAFAIPPLTKTTETKPLSFDDAFNVSTSGDSTSTTHAAPTVDVAQQSVIRSPVPKAVSNGKPLTPTSVRSASPHPASVSSIRAASPPPRAGSPKSIIRTASPKPRISNGSATTSIAAATTTATATPRPGASTSHGSESAPARTSRLSIHFPFGRSKSSKKDKEKDKTKSPAPPPVPQLPNSLVGDNGTPSDDVDAVKNLVGMGFTREQAVKALEKTGYDLNRALNTLLSTA